MLESLEKTENSYAKKVGGLYFGGVFFKDFYGNVGRQDDLLPLLNESHVSCVDYVGLGICERSHYYEERIF